MTFRKLVGLAAIGGFLWQHQKRGGQWTLDSFKQTARGLFDDAKFRAQNIKREAEQKLHENRVGTADDFASASRSSGLADDTTGYGSPGYGYGSNEPQRKY
jgi:hypothetical protein